MAEGGDRMEVDLSDFQNSSEKTEVLGPSSSNSQVKVSANGFSNKKKKIHITDITHVFMEKPKDSMDIHTYQVHVIEENFFSEPRDLEASLRIIAKEVIDVLLGDLDYDQTNMRVGINFTFDNIQSTDEKYHVNISYSNIADDVAVAEITKQLEYFFQSDNKATFSEFKVVATVFKVAKDNVKVSNRSMNTKNVLKPRNVSFNHGYINKTHLDTGTNGCAFKAVVLFRKIANQEIKNPITIEEDAKDLAKSCSLEYTDPFKVDNFKKIEEVEKCRIIVFAPDGQGVKILYNPSNDNRNDPLYIIGHNGEDIYYAIPEDKIKFCFKNTEKKGTYTNEIFCTNCYTFNSNNILHKLDCIHYRCKQCLDYKCHGSSSHKGISINKCSACNREFYNADCFENHKHETCKNIKICCECLILKKADRIGRFHHTCTKAKAYCSICCTVYEPNEDRNHICYMKKTKCTYREVYTCYYDIETYQNDKGKDNKKRKIIKMIPYLLVCQMICNLCSEENNIKCSRCGDPRERIFKSEVEKDPVDQFVEFLMNFSKMRPRSKVIVAAHNGEKFYHQYIYASLSTHPDNKAISNNLIKRGKKIPLMGSKKNIIFRDTLLFIPCALKKMPECMGVSEKELYKCFFPNTFLDEKTFNYKGPIPNESFFEKEKMTEIERKYFENYYKSFKDKEYVIFEECQKYCTQNVNVLRKCIEKLRKKFIDDCGVDCLVDCPTIESLCFSIYKNKFMPKETITILGRENQKLFSNEAIRWIMFKEKTLGIDIEHARNGGERAFKIKDHWLYPDGFGHVNGEKTAFLYHGCYWHGHDCDKEASAVIDGVSAKDRFTITSRKEEMYKKAGFKVVKIWECEWKEEREKDIRDPDNTNEFISIKEYVQRISNDAINNKLMIDKSLFGGRTELFVPYFPPTKSNRIMYLDYTYIYPSVQKRMKYPCGPPVKLIGDKVPDIESFNDGLDDKYFGIAYIKILPPQDLYIPVLAEPIRKEVVFPLCVKCAKHGCEKCTHSENERAIDGVYTTPEIRLALDMGYKLLKIFEVWSFKEQKVLFDKYVDYFLKMKKETSGSPSNIRKDEPDFEEAKGIKLDYDSIENNKGLSFIAKLCLNSLWAKNTQNTTTIEDRICTSDKQVWDLIEKREIEVHSLIPIGSKYAVTTVKNESSKLSSTVTDILIFSFTEAYARIRLYKLLDKVKHKALYCGSDSFIFVSGKNEQNPEILDELRDELSEFGKGSLSKFGEESSFVCTGPESYAPRVRTSDRNTRDTGKTEGPINFENMWKMIVNHCSEKSSNHEESLYENIKQVDVTVKEMNKIQLDKRDHVEEILFHKKVASKDESKNSNTHLKGSNGGSKRYSATTKECQPQKYRKVSSIKETKEMKFTSNTSNKRIFIKNSFRSVPFGFKGILEPLKE